MSSNQTTTDFVSRSAVFFDALVPEASDDELFAAGYLRGHVDLAVGTLQVAEQPFTVGCIVERVEQSLSQAIENGELTPADQQLVFGIWQRVQAATQTE